jgi:DNA repair exonuclease SbcCD nuclease subunit
VIAYPGNIQGRHIREAGAKGCLLVTVDDSHTSKTEFRAIDVLRWADCEVAAEAAERRDDVVAAVAKELARLCAASDGLPLAVRDRITGRCPAHQRLLSDARGLAGDIRAAALDVGGGSVWIEKVKVQTTPTQNLDEKCMGDGPLGELLAVIREYQADDQLLATLGEELEELDRKLPADLLSGEGGLRLLDRSALREALDEVRSLLIERLESQGAAP